MSKFDRLAVSAELEAMNIDYWYQVDHCWGQTAHEYFEPGGTFAIGGRAFAGRDEIREFYGWRKSRGDRTVRHVITNFHVLHAEDGRAKTTSILSIYAADGNPVLPSHPPIQLSDLDDECILGPDNRWLYRSRHIVPLFEGGVPVTLPPGTDR